jgi:hypothetical protein
MSLVPTIDLTDSQEDPGKIEMKKAWMTKKTSQTGLISFMDSYIRLTLRTFTPCKPPIPFSFLSPIFQLLPRQQISVRRTIALSAQQTPTWMTTYLPLSQHKQKSTTLTSSKFFKGCKIWDNQMASLMQSMTFMQYCIDVFIDDNQLWCKDSHGAHNLVIVISPDRQLDIIHTAHDSLGHKAFYTTKAHISQCFWWPSMVSDVH